MFKSQVFEMRCDIMCPPDDMCPVIASLVKRALED